MGTSSTRCWAAAAASVCQLKSGGLRVFEMSQGNPPSEEEKHRCITSLGAPPCPGVQHPGCLPNL